MAAETSVTSGYTHVAAFDSGFLPVGTIHKLFYAQHGSPTGKPVIFLHGGPGGSTSIKSAVFFDPNVYRVVLLDQRGAGKSTPPAELRENTSQLLVSDIETLRRHLGIRQWHMVFGGSWGSTLALLYAQTHPEAVGSLVLRGIFTVRKSELDWFYKDGANHIFPDFHEPYINFLPEEERHDPVEGYYKLLTSDDYDTRLAAAKAWSRYESATSTILVSDDSLRKVDDDEVWAMAHSRIECHYFKHGAWMEDGQLLKKENIDRIRHIPATIVQGRYDMVCSTQPAYDLHKAWPEAELVWIPDAGHSADETPTHRMLVEVCDQYARL